MFTSALLPALPRYLRRSGRILIGAVLVLGVLIAARPALAAGETVNIWLTTTNDSAGRNVVAGLQQQAPIAFSSGNASSGQVITVDERTKYQQFTGAGASMTDTAAYLLGSSGALSSSTQSSVMNALFNPTTGIGLDFLRNPMGASDLARYNYTYDDMPSGQTDPSLANFSISHDLTDILPLTKEAEQLNPGLKLMIVPWSAPAWMKNNGSVTGQGSLLTQDYSAYAQYFVKTIQAYQAQGVHVDYVSPSNEPGCCSGANYPTMAWTGATLDSFAAGSLLPALHAAGLTQKVLALDWNWSNYASYGAQEVNDATVRNDSLFGGVAWHGYDEGSAAEQSTIHNEYPTIGTFDTEHSGGTWIANQQAEDMSNIIDYTRNWGQSVVKWSLAVNQNDGPNNGGCSTCTGLITVHQGDSQSGQVTYTIEYYDMGQLTKFVKPGAYRIESTANATVPNVAWINPDGSKALIAYNGSTGSQPITVNWGGESFTYTLPGQTTATFTWSGTQSGTSLASTGTVGGYNSMCLDVAGGNATAGSAADVYTCNGSTAQQWTVDPNGTVQAMDGCLDVVAGGTGSGTNVDLYTCNGTGAQVWQHQSNGEFVNPQSGLCLTDPGNGGAGTQLQITGCSDSASQQWTLPSGGTTPPPTEAPYGGTPAPIPGTVQAANYDTGGQGVAYNVASVNGSNNSYRSDGVDLETCTDTGCGDDIGWTAAGQWFKYTVNVATAGTYTVSLRLASPNAVTDGLHIANSSGTNLSGNINVPATGGYQTWTTVTANVTLPAGVQTLTINQDNGGWNVHQLTFASSGTSTGSPYGGTPAAVPGTVQAANYDLGGQGVAYNVATVNGTGNSYRSDGVDLETCTDTGCGDDIGWTATGQWFKYTINAATAKTYTVTIRLAAPSAVTDGLHISSSTGANLSGNINVPATGGWQTWTTVTVSVTLPAGAQTLTVNQDNGGWNIHQLTFS